MIDFRSFLHDIYRTFYSKTGEYAFFSSIHGIFIKIYHILDNYINVNKFNRIHIIQSIFYEQNGIKLEINNRNTCGKLPRIWNTKAHH